MSNLAISRCQLCVCLASNVHTFEKCLNNYHSLSARYVMAFFFVCQSNSIRLPLFRGYRVCRGNIRNLLDGPSWEHHSLCLICRSSIGSMCRLVKRSWGYTGCLLRRGIYSPFVASHQTRARWESVAERVGSWCRGSGTLWNG